MFQFSRWITDTSAPSNWCVTTLMRLFDAPAGVIGTKFAVAGGVVSATVGDHRDGAACHVPLLMLR